MSLINYGDNYNLRYANQDPEDMFDGNDLILTKEQYDMLLPKFKISQALAWQKLWHGKSSGMAKALAWQRARFLEDDKRNDKKI